MKVSNISNLSMTSNNYTKANQVRERIDKESASSFSGIAANTCLIVGALGLAENKLDISKFKSLGKWDKVWFVTLSAGILLWIYNLVERARLGHKYMKKD